MPIEVEEIEAILNEKLRLVVGNRNGVDYAAGIDGIRQAAAAIAALRSQDRGAREMREEGLHPRLGDALAELGRHEARERNAIYWWRRASMDKLVALGLVETWRPKSLEHSTRKDLPYRLTEAGRLVLAEREKGRG